MRKLTWMIIAVLALAGLATVPAAWADNIDNVAKVACDTGFGDVLGADSTTTGGLLSWPCSFGDNCVTCLAALLDDGCKFTKELPPVVIEVPTAPYNREHAVVYHLRGRRCAASLGGD